MIRELKLFFLVIGLPAILFALGGLRLLQVEADNARKIGGQALQAKASYAAADIKRRIREHLDVTFDTIDELPIKNYSTLAQISQQDPLIRNIRLRPKAKNGFCRRNGVILELDNNAIIASIPDWLIENGAISTNTNDIDSATTAGLRDKNGNLILKAPGSSKNMFTATVPLGPEIPGVRLFVGWRNADARTAQARSRIYMIGATVLALLLASLLGGSISLWRIAVKARIEARQQTDFTASVSHEFKTPLTAISLAAEFACSHTKEPATHQALQDILEETTKLSRIVSDVLDTGKMSKITSLPTQPMDVGNGIYALANPDAYDHIISNLLDNAAKYAPGSDPERQVRADNDKVYIDIMDRGPGMTPAEMHNAFKRYWRADNSMTRIKGGCGLGLTIARHLARIQGGDLTVSAREGGGCIFTLELKRVELNNG